MKLNFKYVKLKNFFSYGNEEVNFEYKSGLNLVTGRSLDDNNNNGAGKTTLIVESLAYGIFGKTLKGTEKDAVINKDNGKKCKVEVCFEINNSVYRVIRTRKPNSLCVYIDDEKEPIKFDSLKNTQNFIEDIVGINYTCFTNIICLNMNASKPFLDCGVKEKRSILENILNTQVYTDMLIISRENAIESSRDFENKHKQRETIQEKIEIIKNNQQSNIASKETDIINTKKKIEEKEAEKIENKNHTHNEDELIKKQKDIIDDMNYLKNKINTNQIDIKTDLKSKKNEELVLNKLTKDECPLCKSILTDNENVNNYKKQMEDNLITYSKRISDLEKENIKFQTKLNLLNDDKCEYTSKINKINEYKTKNKVINNSIKHFEDQIKTLEKEIENIHKLDDQQLLQKLLLEDEETKEEYEQLEKDKKYYSYMSSILDENGIRRYIFSHILPYFNQKLNEYLRHLGSRYTVIFDEKLNAEVFTTNKCKISYESFSGGEKKRIDLAILLTLTDIAKMQNSIDTNILILDEIIDSAMDSNGVEGFVEFLDKCFRHNNPDKCVYVITHRKEISNDNFDRMIRVEKSEEFSYINDILELK